jgi:hypothetical protein
MTTRTFQQRGQAYATGPVIVAASINGVEVFNGSVPVLNSLVPSTPEEIQPLVAPVLFSWSEDVNFEGTRSMHITVSGGSLLLKNTYANYGLAFDGNPVTRYAGLTGGPELFVPFFAFNADLPPDPCCTDVECANRPTLISDPLSNVSINGVLQTSAHVNMIDGTVLAGQNCWHIPDGAQFIATVNIFAGAE